VVAVDKLVLQSHEDLIRIAAQNGSGCARISGNPNFFFYPHFYNLFCGVKIKAMIRATDIWEKNSLVLTFKISILCSVSILDPNFIIVR
jgi:hypothetical protein